MNTLNLGSDDEPVVKKKGNTRNLKIALGLAAVILIPTIGSTLAASITVGGVGGVEFGQGVVTTAACDTAIDVAPESTLIGAEFYLDEITIYGVDDPGCEGKTFTVRVLDAADGLEVIGNDATFCEFVFRSSDTTISAGDCPVIFSAPNGFTFGVYGTAQILSEAVAGITIESTATTP